MCGIYGAFSTDAQRPIQADVLERMGHVLAHRGPDGGGSHLAGPFGMGMRRLSIIDLAGGDQPIANEDGTVWVVFNGEIYNYRELTADLIARGHRFATSSDTEVLVHLYEEYGERCVEPLRGMFAFAIWDGPRRELLLGARSPRDQAAVLRGHPGWVPVRLGAESARPEPVAQPAPRSPWAGRVSAVRLRAGPSQHPGWGGQGPAGPHAHRSRPGARRAPRRYWQATAHFKPRGGARRVRRRLRRTCGESSRKPSASTWSATCRWEPS